MAVKNQTRTVYPDPWVYEVLGRSSPELNQALACWASLLKRGQAEAEARLKRADWNLLADVLNGSMIDEAWGSPGTIIAAELEDADRVNGVGEKWYGEERGMRIPPLISWLRQCRFETAWAILLATKHFWEHLEIDHANEAWWTIEHRREA